MALPAPKSKAFDSLGKSTEVPSKIRDISESYPCIFLMYKDIVVATKQYIEGVPNMVLVEGLDSKYVPRDLYIVGNNKVTVLKFMIWCSDRLVPRNVKGVEWYLHLLGLEKYDSVSLIRKTKASLVYDNWWVKTDLDDTFEKSTIRGLTNIAVQ